MDHPTAAANIAALIELAARRPGRRILNAADPDAPSALDMSRAIAAHLGHAWEEILLGREDGQAGEGGEEPPGQATLGRHPWDAPHPIVLDMTAAAALGYTPAGDYDDRGRCNRLTAAARGGDDADRSPAGQTITSPGCWITRPRTAGWPPGPTGPDGPLRIRQGRTMSGMRIMEAGASITDPLAPYAQVDRTTCPGPAAG